MKLYEYKLNIDETNSVKKVRINGYDPEFVRSMYFTSN